MKLEKVTFKNKGLVLEEVEDANKPTKVEPENLESIDLGDQEAIAKREEQIKKIIAKRLEANKKVADETKGEDHAILSKDIKVKETLCKNRKEVGVLVESLKEKGIKFFVKKINEGNNRYKVMYTPLKEGALKESDCDDIDIEALEWYVNNYDEGDNITVTADLLNVLEQSLEMYRKHCGKEVKEDIEDAIEDDKASIQRAKDYWANEVYFQLENIEDLSQDERILNASEEQIKEMANRIADKLINDDYLWGEINDRIEEYIYQDEYMLANRKDESLNESDCKEEVCPKCGKHPCECEEHLKEDDENKEDKQVAIEKPINKKISNPRKETKEAESHKGPFEIEYWVDEESRDMGLGDIYLERFDDLEEAKSVADDLFGEVASVEVLDANGQVVYGRYPEDDEDTNAPKLTTDDMNGGQWYEDLDEDKEETMEVEDEDGDEFEIEVFETYEEAWDYLDNLGKEWIKDGVCNDYSIADDSYVIDNGLLLIAYDKDNPEDEDEDGEETGDQCLVAYKKGLEEESLKEEDKPAPKSIEDCQKWVDYDMKHYGKISDNTNEIIKKAGFQIIKDDHGDYEVTAGHFESIEDESKEEKKQFAKKVVQPGVQMDDDDMDAPVSFNEEEAHALIGDKPLVEDQKSQIEMANDFSNTMMNNDSLKSLEDDDNI